MIAPGEVFTEENIATKRPADGLSPIFWDQIIGKKARRLVEPDEKIQWQDIE
jgi:sialic acid synthase SpsE